MNYTGIPVVSAKLIKGSEIKEVSIGGRIDTVTIKGEPENRVLKNLTVVGMELRTRNSQNTNMTIYDGVPTHLPVADAMAGINNAADVFVVTKFLAKDEADVSYLIPVDQIEQLGDSEEPEPEGPAAKKGDKVYDTLGEAFEDLADGETIELEHDAPLGGNVTLPDNATVTILLGGHQITDTSEITVPATTTALTDFVGNRMVAPEGYVISWSSATTDDGWRVTYNAVPSTWPATIILANGTGEKRYETVSDACNATRDGDTLKINEDINNGISLHATDKDGISSGHVTIDLQGHNAGAGINSTGGCYTVVTGNGTITNGTSSSSKAVNAYGGNGTIVIENGTVSSGIAVNSEPGYNDTTADAIINGGTFTGSTAVLSVKKAGGSSRTNGGKITVNDGVFNGPIVVAPEGTLIINGGTFSEDPSAYVAEGYSVREQDGMFVVIPANEA